MRDSQPACSFLSVCVCLTLFSSLAIASAVVRGLLNCVCPKNELIGRKVWIHLSRENIDTRWVNDRDRGGGPPCAPWCGSRVSAACACSYLRPRIFVTNPASSPASIPSMLAGDVVVGGLLIGSGAGCEEMGAVDGSAGCAVLPGKTAEKAAGNSDQRGTSGASSTTHRRADYR